MLASVHAGGLCTAPFFAAVTAGLAAYHTGAGVFGAIIVAFVAGALVLVIGQTVFASTRSPLVRTAIALLFAAPAAVAGYHATVALAQIGVSAEGWRVAFGVIGAILVGGTAWARLTVFAPPEFGAGHGTHSSPAA
ncbi:MAG TPA: hypothetical protein VGF56_01365 [Rhizomicrobium sp.]